MEKGFPIDDLYKHFKMLVEKKELTRAKWEIIKDGIRFQKILGTGLDTLLETYNSFLGSSNNHHLNIYRTAFSFCKKNLWSINPLNHLFVQVTKADLNESQLKVLGRILSSLKEYNHCLQLPAESLISLAESGISRTKLDSNNILLYLNTLQQFKKSGIDDVTFSGFATAFTSLIYLSQNDLKIPLDKIEELTANLYNEPPKTKTFFQSCVHFIKSNLAEKNIKSLKEGIIYHKQNNFDIEELIKAYTKLSNSKLQDKQIKDLHTSIEKYKTKHWRIDELINAYVDATRHKITDEQLQVLDSIIPHFNSKIDEIKKIKFFMHYYAHCVNRTEQEELNKWREVVISRLKTNHTVLPLLHNFKNLLEVNPNAEQWQVYYDTIEELQTDNIEISERTNDDFAALVKKGASLEALKVYKNAISFKNLSRSDLHLIFNYCAYLAENNLYLAMLENYNKAIEGKIITTKAAADKLLVEISIHAAISNLIRNKSLLEAQRFIHNTIRNDHVPYPQQLSDKVHPEAIRVYRETLNTYARIFDVYHGFSSLTFETKKVSDKELSLLAGFGKDLADFTGLINAGNSNDFPGRGFFISGLNSEKIFVEDLNAKEKGLDPIKKYKEAFPQAKDEFEDLSLTDFIFTRGFIAISCKNGDKYNLDGNSYSYIVFNDHYHNYSGNSAFLIPTKILYEKLKGTIIPLDTANVKSLKDINQVGFTPQELFQAASRIQANVLNLGWGSNIGGSLSNAYPPDSSPFHEWERPLAKKNHTEDAYGHIHKSHIAGEYLGSMTPHMDKLLEPLRKAHAQVYTITNRYQNLLDLFRYSLSLWHKGFTIGQNTNIQNQIIENNKEDEKNEQSREIEFVNQKKDNSWKDNPGSLRMLIEAYKWHTSGRLKNITDRNFYPVLVIAETLRYSTKSNSPILLDTYDMVLTANDTNFNFVTDINKLTGTEKDIWLTEVMELALEASKDLRFYDRRDLGIV